MFDEIDKPGSRREVLKFAAASLTLLVSRAALGATSESSILAVRVWPSSDYTRIALEYRRPLKFRYRQLSHPPRLVVDLEDVEFNSVLAHLHGKIAKDDPHIKAIRAGRHRPGVVRLVVDLKGDIKPQVFTLKPVGEYGYRLVLDLYPAEPVDPLMALVDRQRDGHHHGRDEGRKITVMLDPGHGGEDPGAIGHAGTYEKHVVLKIARLLKARLDDEPHIRTVMTRDADFFIPLYGRVQLAQRARADLFVSVHADAFIRPTARGSSVFVLSEHGASSAAARWMAHRENSADRIGGVNVADKDPYLARTLFDLSQTATISDSVKLGKSVLGNLGDVNHLHNGHVEDAAFVVLKAPDIPSIMVDTAFISNPEEERQLEQPRFREKIADAMQDGIKRYIAKSLPSAKQIRA